nr:hypothetical protein [Pyrococcus abyssi]
MSEIVVEGIRSVVEKRQEIKELFERELSQGACGGKGSKRASFDRGED